jgi:glucokinase
MYYIGFDIGGMSVKGACVDEAGKIYAEGSLPTNPEKGGDGLVDTILSLYDKLVVKSAASDICGIGAGCPGIIDSGSGTVVFAGNLNLKNYPLGTQLSKVLNKKVIITNDANAAALGEGKFGAGKHYSDSILVTLGTGVGGGIIIGGKLFEGNMSAGAEIGHMVIVKGGESCTCGRHGCLEAYASATALIKMTKKAMVENPHSKMWTAYTLDNVNGKTAFDFSDCDEAAKSVVDNYINYLGCGLTNLANIFRPQVIMLGGGVAAQGDKLTLPLQKIVDGEVMGGNDRARVKITTATLGNKAGVLGAAALAM